MRPRETRVERARSVGGGGGWIPTPPFARGEGPASLLPASHLPAVKPLPRKPRLFGGAFGSPCPGCFGPAAGTGLPWATLGYFGLPGHFGQGGKVSAPSRLPPARIKPFLTGEGRGRLQGRGLPLVSVCVLGSGDRLLAKGGVSPFDEDITRSALPILRHREPGSP